MSSVVGHLVFAALSVPVACAVARHRARFHGATDDLAASGDHTQPSSASVGVEDPGRGQAGALRSKSAVHRPITEPNHVSNDAASGVSADKARTTTEECASQNAGANTDAEPARPLAHGPSVLHQVQASSVPAGHDAQPRTPQSTSTDCMPGGDRVSPLRDHVSPLRGRVSPVRGYSVSRASSPVSDGSRDEALANLLGEVNGSASSYSYASGSQVHVIAHTASLVFTRQQGSQGSEGDDGSSDSSRAHAQQFAAAVAAAQVERRHDNSGQRRTGDSGDGTGTGMNATPAFASPGAAVGRVDSGSVDSPASATDSPTGQASPSWSRGPPHVHQGTGVGSPHHSPSRSTPGLPFSAKVSSPLVPERRRIGAQLDRRDAERSASPTQSLTGRPTVNIPIPSMGSMRSCPATTSSGPKSAGRRLNMSLSGEDTAGSPSVYLGSPRAALHTPSGTSVGSSVSRFSPFRRHAEAGGSPMSGRAKQLWKSFRHRATSLISATKVCCPCSQQPLAPVTIVCELRAGDEQAPSVEPQVEQGPASAPWVVAAIRAAPTHEQHDERPTSAAPQSRAHGPADCAWDPAQRLAVLRRAECCAQGARHHAAGAARGRASRCGGVVCGLPLCTPSRGCDVHRLGLVGLQRRITSAAWRGSWSKCPSVALSRSPTMRCAPS